LSNYSSTFLNFSSYLAVENSSYFDIARVYVSDDNGVNWQEMWKYTTSTGTMTSQNIDLSVFDGNVIQLRFAFDTVDGIANNYEGWVLDDVMVAGVFTPPVAQAIPAMPKWAMLVLTMLLGIAGLAINTMVRQQLRRNTAGTLGNTNNQRVTPNSRK
jgi:hypothetical protein